ncbi:hypothetical protein DYB32_009194 [Aphanomyces invadans]|uniref:DNA-directed primase/polymerase protein n=1 Tax=Aphanomyces invadans TaxID=157072 RepID=A0A418AIZ9_9STRA|nr:hypothetical protein DYB32_009194 [Aphanomyces invadans]
MRFRLHLAIDDEVVGNINMDCRAAEKKIVFRMQNLTQANVLSLTLQTMFPTIPWLTDDRATGGPRLLRKRPRRESTRESFYGSSSSLAPSFPMVNAAFDAAFHYRVQHSIECQLDGTAPVHHVFALQQPAIDFIGQIQARRPTHRKFGIHVSADKNMVDLVSTAPDKFSRHLVVIAPDGALFVNNLEAGQELMDTFALHADDSGDLSFNVMDQHNQPQTFIDMGVYTRYPIPSSPNASSRVAGIERFGKHAAPIPPLAAFVVALATAQDNVQAGIRAWQVIPHRSITYHLVNNRYCHNVRRAHKSNNVMYVVDHDRIVQKCHDPNCATFTSRSWPLPAELRTAIASFLACEKHVPTYDQ